jgi:cyclopropane-fatty-acyl-phospholipid synthase
MWEFYLAGSEASFRWQDLMVFQIQLTRRNDTLPITRDYIGKCEKALAIHEEAHRKPVAARKARTKRMPEPGE